MATTPADWVATAISITPSFESSGDPYLAVSGDFDGMGISCGALQWNIGQGSLQPMVRAAGKPVVRAAMPDFGEAMWEACNGPVVQGLRIVRSWQTGARLKPRAKAELTALMGAPEMRDQQQSRIDRVADGAFAHAGEWARRRGDGPVSKRLFCWFFDVITQNGGLEGLTPDAVRRFIELNTPSRVDDLICDFLGSRAGSSGHVRDANRNASLWRNGADGEKLEVLCMSYLRSQTANPRWRHVVLNRKGAIAMGDGWVNSSLHDFSTLGL